VCYSYSGGNHDDILCEALYCKRLLYYFHSWQDFADYECIEGDFLRHAISVCLVKMMMSKVGLPGLCRDGTIVVRLTISGVRIQVTCVSVRQTLASRELCGGQTRP
jgi:hypothetical protein